MNDDFNTSNHSSTSTRARTPQWLIALVLLVVVGGVVFTLFSNKKEVKKRPAKGPEAALVKTQPLQAINHQPSLTVSATIEAYQPVDLVAEMTAKAIYVNPKFQLGQSVRKGQVLVRLDDEDLRRNTAIKQASITQAQFTLKQELANAKIAQQDWRLFADSKNKPGELASRSAHVNNARAAVKIAQEQLSLAQYNQRKAVITAPFDSMVSAQNVQANQRVTNGFKMGSLMNTKMAEVVFYLSSAEMSQAALEKGTKIAVENSRGDQWSASISNISPILDPELQKLKVVAHLSDPFALQKGNALPPLVMSQTVTAKLPMPAQSRAYKAPKTALYDNTTVYLYADKQLKAVPVQVIDSTADAHYFISTQDITGQTLVINRIAGAQDGKPATDKIEKPTKPGAGGDKDARRAKMAACIKASDKDEDEAKALCREQLKPKRGE